MEKTNFEKYNMLHNEIMKKLEIGDITVEKAKEINDLAFDKYIIEAMTINRLDNKKLVYDKNKKESKNLGVRAYELLCDLDKIKEDKKTANRENPNNSVKNDEIHNKAQNKIWRELKSLSDEEYAVGKRMYDARFHRNRLRSK